MKKLSLYPAGWPSKPEQAVCEGRYGFDYIHNPERLQMPLIRRSDVPKSAGDTFDPQPP